MTLSLKAGIAATLTSLLSAAPVFKDSGTQWSRIENRSKKAFYLCIEKNPSGSSFSTSTKGTITVREPGGNTLATFSRVTGQADKDSIKLEPRKTYEVGITPPTGAYDLEDITFSLSKDNEEVDFRFQQVKGQSSFGSAPKLNRVSVLGPAPTTNRFTVNLAAFGDLEYASRSDKALNFVLIQDPGGDARNPSASSGAAAPASPLTGDTDTSGSDAAPQDTPDSAS